MAAVLVGFTLKTHTIDNDKDADPAMSKLEILMAPQSRSSMVVMTTSTTTTAA